MRKYYSAIVYVLLALLVMGPLLLPGYVLTLDMVFAPEIRMPANVVSHYPLRAVMHAADWLLPSQVVQKLMLVLVLFLAGYGMHRLVRYVGAADKLGAVAYLAGAIYMINPFTYGRFVTGQWLVLFGMALLPWFMRALLVFVARPAWKSAVVVGLWAAAVSMVSIHSIVPMFIIGGLVMGWRLWQLRGKLAGQRRLVHLGGLAAVVWLVVNSYWLVPALLGKGATAQTVGGFAGGDQTAFATVGGSVLERVANVVALQGFWVEDRGLFRLSQEGVPGWWLLLLGLLALVVYGGVVAWRRQRGMAAVFIGCIVAGVVLGAGVGIGWLAGHVPFLAGYREPQKFVMLVALGYAVFAAYGVVAVWEKARAGMYAEYALPALGVIFAALPFLFTLPMMWGAGGQLRAADYPRGWYVANEKLNADKGDFKVLALPWHMYMFADFAGRTIANPAANFFDKPVVVSDDPEFKGASLSGSTAVKRGVDAALRDADAGESDERLGEELARLKIKYVLLAETSDFEEYGYLDKQRNLELVGDFEGMRLYRNLAYR